MKKIYLTACLLTLGLVSSAQVLPAQGKAVNTAKNAPVVEFKGKPVVTNQEKVEYLNEDFETWPLTGWTIESGTASSITDPDQTWHEATTGNPGGCASIIYVNSVDQHDEYLISPEITLPAAGAYRIGFDFNTSTYWHAGQPNDNVDVTLQISLDNGATWDDTLWQEDIQSLLEASFSDGWVTYVWKRALVNISAYAGNDVKFRFKYFGIDGAQFNLDNVIVDDIPADDIMVSNFYQATDITTTQALDYYMVPESQVSFPGLTFGATALNIGSANQADVALNATDGGTYDETSASIAINVGATDSLEITAPYMLPTALGSYTLDLTSVITGTDAQMDNNMGQMTITRDAFLYGRDDDNVTGSIGQVSSQDGVSLAIGNLFEIFDDMDATSIQVRLIDQAAAAGQAVRGLLYIFNETTGDFDYLSQTDDYIIQAGDLDGFINMPLFDVSSLSAGAVVLVMAQHDGGAEEVAFGYAQPTEEGTVLGITADGEFFTLLEPNAIMIRLSDDPSASVAALDLEGVEVYPNPSTGIINVTNDLNVENTITVLDLTGKVVAAKVASSSTTLDLTAVGTGIYLVEVANANGKKVERVVIK